MLNDKLRKELEAQAKKSEDTAELVELITERTYQVSVGHTYYVSGGIFSALLPDDKQWMSGPGEPAFAAYGDQLINVFEPATLSRLLSTATGKKGDQYRGSITFAQLYKLSPPSACSSGSSPRARSARRPSPGG